MITTFTKEFGKYVLVTASWKPSFSIVYLLWTSPLKDEKQCFPRCGYQEMQRKKARRTLPRFPRLIPIVFPAVVMIERCRPLCSLKSLIKNPSLNLTITLSLSNVQHIEI